MNSPRYAPAGLLIEYGKNRVMLDGGPGSEPSGRLDAWLVTDAQGELMPDIRALARAKGFQSCVAPYSKDGVTVRPRPVVHTSHPSYGYLLRSGGRKVVWAPEFFAFPAWAAGADLMFAEASSWDRPIRFADGVGGHCPVQVVAQEAKQQRIKRLVFAHIGRPTIRALDAGKQPRFGQVGKDGEVYLVGQCNPH